MRFYFKAFIVSSILLCVASSCQKEEYQTQLNGGCFLNPFDNPKHDSYQEILDTYSESGIVGLSVVLDKKGEESWFGTSGFSSVEENIEMKNCNIFQTASLAKSFIAVITLQLIEESSLNITDDISQYLPQEILNLLPLLEGITIKNLLQQTSGLQDIFDLNFISDFMNDPSKIYSREELLGYVSKKELLNAPGEKHHYADTNYILLSLIIDRVEGDHIKAMDNRIIKPLNLDKTFYHSSSYPDFEELPQSYWDQYNSGEIENISMLQKRVSSYIMGSDGIIASPKNMVTFFKSVFEDDLLSDFSKEMILNEFVIEEEAFRMNNSYSHGFMVIESSDETWIGHAGNQLGTSCYVFYNLETEDCIGVFTNIGTFFFQEKQALIFSELWEKLKFAIQ